MTDHGQVDIEAKVFENDASLRTFFQSGEAKLIYAKCFLLPFIQQHTQAACYNFLDQPPESLLGATTRFVQKMAAGGIHEYIPQPSASAYTHPAEKMGMGADAVASEECQGETNLYTPDTS